MSFVMLRTEAGVTGYGGNGRTTPPDAWRCRSLVSCYTQSPRIYVQLLPGSIASRCASRGALCHCSRLLFNGKVQYWVADRRGGGDGRVIITTAAPLPPPQTIDNDVTHSFLNAVAVAVLPVSVILSKLPTGNEWMAKKRQNFFSTGNLFTRCGVF